MLRLEMLYDDLRPEAEADRTAFYHGPAWNSALDAAIADAAAADPTHPKLPHLRHWLAYGLWLADRPHEALNQFRALGPHVDADPWTRWNDPVAKVVAARDDCVEALTRAGWLSRMSPASFGCHSNVTRKEEPLRRRDLWPCPARRDRHDCGGRRGRPARPREGTMRCSLSSAATPGT